MRLEQLDRRVLGAVRFVDVTTGLGIGDALAVAAEGARLTRNRGGAYVILSAPGLESHTEAFVQPPAAPALGSVALTLRVSDPSGRYLARRGVVRLPRDPDPAHADQPESLFRPLELALFPAPAAGVSPGWALVRAAVTRQGSATPLPGALIRVVRTSDSARLALGMADARGEALVPVAGIPITTWGASGGAVVVHEVDVTLETIVDPAASGPPDPDDLEARRGTLPHSHVAAKLAAGRTLIVELAVVLA